MIDYIGFYFNQTSENEITLEHLNPQEIINKRTASGINTNNCLSVNDDQYLVTNPGESLEFSYNIEKRSDVEQTLFVSSGGYYNEWVRGGWIKNNPSGYKFDLFKISETLRVLADSWEENKELIESEFFRTRIPLKEK